ncbi:MAG: hypothetical protein PHS14_00175 [Elusimicrobia bacterium]|nr:hypothetical protein [Elusimicrobiota bacterium]
MKLKSLALTAALLSALAVGARVAYAFLGGTVVSGTYAVSQVVPISLGGGVQSLSAVVDYSTPTFSAATFTTGQVSTGSITIADNTKLSTAAATESIVVKSTSGALGDFVSMSCPIPPGAVVVRVNRDWVYGPNVSSAAINLAEALTNNSSCLGGVQFIASGAVVYATAPVGGLYNAISVVTNNTTTLTVSSATFLGGRDSAVVTVNGTPFKANTNFTVGVDSATSASNLATAINAKAPLNTFVTATAGSGATAGIVALQSKSAGSTYNLPLATSNSAAVSVFGPALYGGVTPSWTLNASFLSAPSNGFVTGLPVLYSTGVGSPAISGLTNQTTYYVLAADANLLGLATSSANAVNAVLIPLASSSTLTAAKTYSLTPLPFDTGSAGFSWSVSNSASGPWTDLAGVSSVTYSTPGTSVWSFGALPFRYLGVNVTAPDAGALTLQVNAQGQ